MPLVLRPRFSAYFSARLFQRGQDRLRHQLLPGGAEVDAVLDVQARLVSLGDRPERPVQVTQAGVPAAGGLPAGFHHLGAGVGPRHRRNARHDQHVGLPCVARRTRSMASCWAAVKAVPRIPASQSL